MKKIFFIVLAALFMGLASNVHAQEAKHGTLKYSFGVYKNANGEKVSKQDLKNYLDAYQYVDYQNALRKFKKGAIYTGVGVGLLAGTAVIVEKHGDGMTGLLLSSLPATAGVICSVIGIPKLIVGDNGLKKVANDYNNQNKLSFSVGCQQYGYGLAINF